MSTKPFRRLRPFCHLVAWLLAFNLSLLTFNCPALTPVQFNLLDDQDQPLTLPITVQGLKLQAGGVYLLAGLPIVLHPAAGTITTNLHTGRYTCSVQGISQVFIIDVPDTNTVQTVTSLILSGAPIYTYTNNWNYTFKLAANDTTPGFLSTKLLPGANISFQTNNPGGNESLTITSIGGGGSGIPYRPGTNVAITNVSGTNVISVPVVPFANLTSTPTTLAGYGITDAQPHSTNLDGWSGFSSNAVAFLSQLISATNAALAPAQIPNLDAAKITTGVFPIARLATGTPDGTKFIRDDGTLAVPAGGGTGILLDVTNTGGGISWINRSNTTVPIFKSLTNSDGTLTATDNKTNIDLKVNAIAESQVANLVTDLSFKVGTTTTLALNGTANQVTSSAGAQDLSANRTWTFSLPQDLRLLTSGSLMLSNGGSGNYITSTNGNTTNSGTIKANALIGDISGGTGLTSSQIPSLDAAKITTGVLAIGRLATGTPDGTKFVRDDGTLVTPSGAGGAVPLANTIITVTNLSTVGNTNLVINVLGGGTQGTNNIIQAFFTLNTNVYVCLTNLPAANPTNTWEVQLTLTQDGVGQHSVNYNTNYIRFPYNQYSPTITNANYAEVTTIKMRPVGTNGFGMQVQGFTP